MKKIALLAMLALVASLLAVPAAFAAEPIIIGVPTSVGFLEGKESLGAVKLAVDEINAAGGVNVAGVKRPFKVVVSDIRDAAPGVPVPDALKGMEKMILENKPHALLVGPFRSEALMAGMDLIAKYKVPLLGTVAMTPKTEGMVAKDPKYKYVFRVCLNAIYFVKYLVGTMGFLHKQFGFKRIYIMHQDVAWARITAKIVSAILTKKLKMEVVGVESFPTGSSKFGPALMKVKMKKAQVILPIFDMPQSGILVKQWKAMKVPAMLAGFISPLAGPAAWKTFDGKIGGAINCVFEIGNIPAAKYQPARDFAANYQKKYGQPIQAGHGPAPSYASVYLLKAAIERAGSLKADAIVAALEKTDAKAVMGRVKFTKGHQVIYGHDPAQEALGCVFQWTEGGKRVIVYPPAIAEGKIQLPPWMKAAK